MYSALLIINDEGKCLISKKYREVNTNTISKKFYKKIIKEEEYNPVISIDNNDILYVKCSNFFIALITNNNSNVQMGFEYLYKLIQIFKSYFINLIDESITDNFVIIYELLDETMDFGYPQITDGSTLKKFIHVEHYKTEIFENNYSYSNKLENKDNQITKNITALINWRNEKIFYKENRIRFDVIEYLSVTLNKDGKLLNYSIKGNIVVDCFLSGIPTLKMKIKNFDIEKNLIKSDKCITKLEKNKIYFIPYDKKFSLLEYNVVLDKFKEPFLIHTILVYSQNKIKYIINILANFSRKKYANHIIFKVPIPNESCNINYIEFNGEKVERENDVLKFYYEKITGEKKRIIEFEVNILSTEKVNIETRDIEIIFELKGLNFSEIEVEHLKLINEDYKFRSEIKYLILSSKYYSRINNKK